MTSKNCKKCGVKETKPYYANGELCEDCWVETRRSSQDSCILINELASDGDPFHRPDRRRSGHLSKISS